jgi:hypothetical protein
MTHSATNTVHESQCNEHNARSTVQRSAVRGAQCNEHSAWSAVRGAQYTTQGAYYNAEHEGLSTGERQQSEAYNSWNQVHENTLANWGGQSLSHSCLSLCKIYANELFLGEGKTCPKISYQKHPCVQNFTVARPCGTKPCDTALRHQAQGLTSSVTLMRSSLK